jgi:hypothetical protein
LRRLPEYYFTIHHHPSYQTTFQVPQNTFQPLCTRVGHGSKILHIQDDKVSRFAWGEAPELRFQAKQASISPRHPIKPGRSIDAISGEGIGPTGNLSVANGSDP